MVQLQASSFFERLTAREQIHTFAAMYGVGTDVLPADGRRGGPVVEGHPVRHAGLLGRAVAASASFGAAATLNGWRNSKLLRRLQLAPVPTRTVVGARLAGAVAKSTEGAVNMANFIVLPMSFLSGSFFSLDGSPSWLQNLSKVFRCAGSTSG